MKTQNRIDAIWRQIEQTNVALMPLVSELVELNIALEQECNV